MEVKVYKLNGLAVSSTEPGEAAVDEKEITELMGEHQAIKAHMNFLAKSFKSVATVSGGVITQSIRSNDLLSFYLWPLYDLREAIHRHFVLDERIFSSLGNSIGDIVDEHQAIKKEIDDIIHSAEIAVYNKLSQEELDQYAFIIRDKFKRMSESVEAHTTKEDRLLK